MKEVPQRGYSLPMPVNTVVMLTAGGLAPRRRTVKKTSARAATWGELCQSQRIKPSSGSQLIGAANV
jgi:hypothetical protein